MASDGEIGTVGDLLFDDKTWKVRWIVVDTGSWLTGRQTLLHPSAIVKTDYLQQVVTVSLTKTQVQNGPNILTDQPVSRQMQNSLFEYYGWDPLWGGSRFERGVIASPLQPSHNLDTALRGATSFEAHLADQDVDLRSMVAVTGYHCHASDGVIGHLQDVLIDDGTWTISYLIIDTANWWPGQRVLLSPHAVKTINWSRSQIELSISRDQVKASPPWDPLAIVDQAYEDRLHHHYGWPDMAYSQET
jgi:sporulation protein YlmC with PRC-barrel domain